MKVIAFLDDLGGLRYDKEECKKRFFSKKEIRDKIKRLDSIISNLASVKSEMLLMLGEEELNSEIEKTGG